MTTGNLSRRVTALEERNAGAGRPLYAAFDDDADLDAAQLGPGVLKVYVGCSPDDWPGDVSKRVEKGDAQAKRSAASGSERSG